MLDVIFYFKLRNIVISQFWVRNIVLVIFIKIKTRLNAFFKTNGILGCVGDKIKFHQKSTYILFLLVFLTSKMNLMIILNYLEALWKKI